MKVKVTVKYSEYYIPPRCRKPRQRSCEKETTVTIRETTSQEAPIAFIAHKWDGDVEYRYYKGKCYTKSLYKDHHCGKIGLFPPEMIGDYLRGSYDYWNYDYKTNRKSFADEAGRYLLIDGVVWEHAGEPRYVVMTFGLGHNHGGTALMMDECYNSNISKDRYFSALDGDAAVNEANLVAQHRGDTKDVGKFEKFIEVLMPQVVKVKPQKQHGDGDPFLNDIEGLINASESAMEAGLLTMLFTAAKK